MLDFVNWCSSNSLQLPELTTSENATRNAPKQQYPDAAGRPSILMLILLQLRPQHIWILKILKMLKWLKTQATRRLEKNH